MAELDETLSQLSDQHRRALEWFRERRGQEIPWPEPLPDGTHLVNRPKGIHKPRGWRHALSVRQSLNGPYADEAPVVRPDGAWTYRYFQEALNPNERDEQFTNRALLACQEDGVPVAVLRQTRPKPNVRYEVLGLARVLGWKDGYFTLEGYGPDGKQRDPAKDRDTAETGESASIAEKHTEVPQPRVPENVASIFTDPPPRSGPQSPRGTQRPGATTNRTDWEARDAQNTALGRAGERFVLELERNRLTKAGKADLAAKVTWISEEQGDGAGYDIGSFDKDGSPRLIEVKTTNGPATTSFLVTANEVQISRANPDTYWLYRVYDFAKAPRIYCVKGPLDDGWTLEPAVYRAKR